MLKKKSKAFRENQKNLKAIKAKNEALEASGDKAARKISTIVRGKDTIAPIDEKRIKAILSKAEHEALLLQAAIQEEMKERAISTIIATAQLNKLSPEIVEKLVKQVSLDKLSTAMRPGLSAYRNDLLRALKSATRQGQSILSLAERLTAIDKPIINIPLYIRRIKAAAQKAVADPAHYKDFLKVLNRNKTLINRLTRRGEPGFQELGLRRAGRKFLSDIKKAIDTNTIDNTVNDWARKKAGYIQKRVARTEASTVINKYTEAYGRGADHVKGLGVRLSTSHPEADICDDLAGDYLYANYDEDGIPIPPHHPNCICYTEYLFYQDFLNNPEDYEPKAA